MQHLGGSADMARVAAALQCKYILLCNVCSFKHLAWSRRLKKANLTRKHTPGIVCSH